MFLFSNFFKRISSQVFQHIAVELRFLETMIFELTKHNIFVSEIRHESSRKTNFVKRCRKRRTIPLYACSSVRLSVVSTDGTRSRPSRLSVQKKMDLMSHVHKGHNLRCKRGFRKWLIFLFLAVVKTLPHLSSVRKC